MIQGAVLLAGRVPALLAQASGLSLRASLEIGSSFGVKCHQLNYTTKSWCFLVPSIFSEPALLLLTQSDWCPGVWCRYKNSIIWYT